MGLHPRIRNIGSAKILKGDCLVVSIFVNYSKNRWNKTKKYKVLGMLNKATQWLIDRARDYGVGLSFYNISIGSEDDIIMLNIPDKDADSYNEWVRDLTHQMGYDSPISFYNMLRDTGNYDNINVIVFVNDIGISYALPFFIGADRDYFLEAAVIYKNDGYTDITASLIAHEILHLYGAYDLYSYDSDDLLIEDVVKKDFPTEIMFELQDDIEDNTISDITAYYIGWIEYIKPIYKKIISKR